MSADTSKLRVFISSTMSELRDVREVVHATLQKKGLDPFIFESDSRAQPENVVTTSLEELERCDLYVGLFERKFGEVTAKEFLHARKKAKPCFIYIRDKDAEREPELEAFLTQHVRSIELGVTYEYFTGVMQLGEQVAEAILSWLVKRHREMTADLSLAQASQTELDRLKAEVQKLQSTSREPLPQGGAVDLLAKQLRAWFSTLNYTFEQHDERTDTRFEWIINVPNRRGYDRILVHGIEGEAQCPHVIDLGKASEKHQADEGWLISARRLSPAALDDAKRRNAPKLFCYTVDTLIDESAEFKKYFEWLDSEVRRRGIDQLYVQLGCKKEEIAPASGQKVGESNYLADEGGVDGYVDRWLDDPSKQHISILGEFGTGKTWFALHYAWQMLKRYQDAKARGVERPRVPLYIPLRDYARAVTVESLFSEFFFRKYEIPLPGYSAFEQLNRMGKLLLIFDGFDEMAMKVDRQSMIDHFWQLARAVVPRSKVLLTSRLEHFPNGKESRDLLGAELKASTDNLSGAPPQFEVLELAKFSDTQIEDLLSRRTKPEVVEKIVKEPRLLDLARRPVMVDLILEALPEIEAGKRVDISRVYLYAIRRKMERDIKDARTFTSLADKLYFLCELSWEMLSTDQMSINYRQFPERIRRLFGPVVQKEKDLDHWHYDMMGQTLLIRSADGDYMPAHRSLLEFFTAYKFAAELGLLAEDFTEVARAQSGVDNTVGQIDQTWSEYFTRKLASGGTLQPNRPLQRFSREDPTHLVQGFAKHSLSDAARQLMADMLEQDAVEEDLVGFAVSTRGKPVEEIQYSAVNALSLARWRKRNSLAGKDLSGLYLQDLKLHNADLSGTRFDGSDLSRSKLTECNARSASFRHCKFTNASLENPRIVAYSWVDGFVAALNPRTHLSIPGINVAQGEAVVVRCDGSFPQMYGAEARVRWSFRLVSDGVFMRLNAQDNMFLLTIEGQHLAVDFETGRANPVEDSPILTFRDADFEGAVELNETSAAHVRLLGAKNVLTVVEPAKVLRHGP